MDLYGTKYNEEPGGRPGLTFNSLKRSTQEQISAYLFLAPFLITLAVFFLYSTGRAFYFSFTDYNLFADPNWVGLENYLSLFRQSLFLRALQNTLLFSVIVTTVQTFLALVMATVLNQRIRGLAFFRAAYYIPSIASSVVITLIFMWMYQRRGLINYLWTEARRHAPIILLFIALVIVLQVAQVIWERRRGYPARWVDPALFLISFTVGAIGTLGAWVAGVVSVRPLPPVDFTWLATRVRLPGWAPSFLRVPVPLVAIMIQNIFTTIPTMMIMYLAALQGIPPSFYEAADIEGASVPQKFFRITIPSVRPVTFLVVALSLIGTLQMFDQVAIFGDAVPLESVITLSYYVYDRMFPGAQLPQVGLASAAAMFLAILTMLAVLVQRVFIKSEAE